MLFIYLFIFCRYHLEKFDTKKCCRWMNIYKIFCWKILHNLITRLISSEDICFCCFVWCADQIKCHFKRTRWRLHKLWSYSLKLKEIFYKVSLFTFMMFSLIFTYRICAIEGRGFYSKNIFWTNALWYIWPKFVQAHIVEIGEIHLNATILGCGYNSRATLRLLFIITSVCPYGLLRRPVSVLSATDFQFLQSYKKM